MYKEGQVHVNCKKSWGHEQEGLGTVPRVNNALLLFVSPRSACFLQLVWKTPCTRLGVKLSLQIKAQKVPM